MVPTLVTSRTADSESGSENLSVRLILVFPPAVSVCDAIVVAVTGLAGGRTTRTFKANVDVHPLAKVALSVALKRPY